MRTKRKQRGDVFYIPQISQLPENLHPSAWIADRSVEFIKNEKNSDKPWYLFSSFIHPHPPFAPPNPWHKLYRAAMMPLPNIPQDFECLQTFVNKAQNRYKYRDNGIDNNLLRVMKAYYYSCISFVDYQIGRILDCLEDSGLIDNTMIVFTSDHGEHLGDYNCFGKRSFHDSASRIPMIIRLKGLFDGGKICDIPVSLVDLAPTFLRVADVNNHGMKFDGIDMYEILTNKSSRKIVFGQHSYDLGNPIEEGKDIPKEFNNDNELFRASKSTYMAVSREWKYIYSAGDDKEILFDKLADPFETRNKAGLLFTKDVLSDMRKATIKHLESGKETSGIENDKFKSFPSYELPRDPDSGLLIQDLYVPEVRCTLNLKGYDK